MLCPASPKGLPLEVTVTTADVHDSKAAPALPETFVEQPGLLLKLVWVDSAYQGPALAKGFARHGVRIEVVRRSDGQCESRATPGGKESTGRRRVVERSLVRSPERAVTSGSPRSILMGQQGAGRGRIQIAGASAGTHRGM
jgi:hypothetical protein